MIRRCSTQIGRSPISRRRRPATIAAATSTSGLAPVHRRLSRTPGVVCRIEGGDDGRWLVTGLDGVQRVSGTIYTDTDRRAVFLGTIAFAEERRPAAYGHAAGRDMAGVVERIGEGRWRLALPFPPLGGALALVEFSAR